MTAKKTDEPRHFDLTPADFTGDHDFQLMTASQRGIYCSIIFYLYQNKGVCNLNETQLKDICKASRNFPKDWAVVRQKFTENEQGLTQSRVTKEYKKAKKRMQDAKKAGSRGAKKRWGSYSNPNSDPNSDPNSNPNGVVVAKQNKTKLNKTKLNTPPLTPPEGGVGEGELVKGSDGKLRPRKTYSP